MQYKVFIVSLFLLSSSYSYSEILMPVLYGWYTDAKFDYIGSCFDEHYQYENLGTESAFDLAQKILITKVDPNCYWENVTLKDVLDNKPPDFPGEYEQWTQFSKNTSLITKEASRECVDSAGRTWYIISKKLYPS